ncbi:MAG: hypothetical protein ACP5QO_05520 [Clostridia bacterium]
MRILPYRGAEPPLCVLVLTSEGGGNIRCRSLVQHGPFALTVLAVDFPSAPLPPYYVVLNAIGDSDHADPALEFARTLAGRTRARVVAAPLGIIGPRMLDAVRHRVLDGQAKVVQEKLSGPGIAPPLLLGPPGFHTGRHLVRVKSPEDFPAAMDRIPGAGLSAIEFLDTRGPDGLYRTSWVWLSTGGSCPEWPRPTTGWCITRSP